MAYKKTATFISQDKELVRKIEQYQKTHNLTSFIATIRELCNIALTLKEITK